MAAAGAADTFRGSTVPVAAGAFAVVRRPDGERCWPKNLSPVRFFWLIHFHIPPSIPSVLSNHISV